MFRDREQMELVIIEPDAITSFGHYLQLIDRLTETCKSKDLRLRVFGPTAASEEVTKSRPNFHKVLSGRSWDTGLKGVSSFDAPVRALTADLEAAVQRLIKPETWAHLFMYTGSPAALASIMATVDAFPNLSATVCLFYLSFPDAIQAEKIYRWKHILRAGHRHPRITLLCPTSILADELRTVLNLECGVLPHPSTTFGDDEAYGLLGREVRTAPSGSFEITFPGGMLYEKGFLITEQIVKLSYEKNINAKFTVRAHIRETTPEPLRKATRSLQDLATMLTGELSLEDYRQLFLQSDIIVLPYSPRHFGTRTSGAFVDALYCGMPTVCHADTWMGRIVLKHGLGEVVTSEEGAAYVQALEKVLAKPQGYFDNVARIQREYLEQNTWRSFLEVILPDSMWPSTHATPQSVLPKNWYENSADFAGQVAKPSARVGQAASATAQTLTERDAPPLRSSPFTEIVPTQEPGLALVEDLVAADGTYRHLSFRLISVSVGGKEWVQIAFKLQAHFDENLLIFRENEFLPQYGIEPIAFNTPNDESTSDEYGAYQQLKIGTSDAVISEISAFLDRLNKPDRLLVIWIFVSMPQILDAGLKLASNDSNNAWSARRADIASFSAQIDELRSSYNSAEMAPSFLEKSVDPKTGHTGARAANQQLAQQSSRSVCRASGLERLSKSVALALSTTLFGIVVAVLSTYAGWQVLALAAVSIASLTSAILISLPLRTHIAKMPTSVAAGGNARTEMEGREGRQEVPESPITSDEDRLT